MEKDYVDTSISVLWDTEKERDMYCRGTYLLFFSNFGWEVASHYAIMHAVAVDRCSIVVLTVYVIPV